jgi:hypothetical protein
MSCERCRGISTRRIGFPAELTEAIRYCKELFASGAFRMSSYWPERTPRLTATDWTELSETGPWEDILQYYFECPSCGQIFLLHADTYHGAGSLERCRLS